MSLAQEPPDAGPDLPETGPPSDDSSIWPRFVEVLRQRGVKAPFDRWFVLRAEQFQKTLPNQALGTCSESDAVAYFERAARRADLKNWQYEQIVAAVEILLAHVLGLPWAAGFDWASWRKSARRLEPNRASATREFPSQEPTSEQLGHRITGSSEHDGLLTSVENEIRRRGYSIRTERTHLQWIRRFIASFGNRDPSLLGAKEVKTFLERLAVHGNVAASTQNQALSALVFLYREVLGRALELESFARAKRPRRLPVVLRRAEVRAVLGELDGTYGLMASLLYGAGLRLMEAVRLRVKDVDFGYRQIVVRDAKGAKDRVVPLPETLIAPLRAHLVRVRVLFDGDCRQGLGHVRLPGALAKKYPNASDPPARSRLRHPHHAGAPRSRRRFHDDDLHARAQ